METRNTVREQDEHSTGTWVVITAGPARAIGRVVALDHDPLITDSEVPVTDVTSAKVVTLYPCYDFFAPLRPVPIIDPQTKQPRMIAPGVPQMGMARDPIVTGRDFAVHPHPVHITIGSGVFFDFFSEMHADDRATYIGFINAARGATTAHRAEKVGLLTAKDSDLDALLRGGGRGRQA
jgi:hypothetical protein